MNYRSVYDTLIEKYGVWKKPFGVYTERHRKVPGHFGGRYIKGNAFYLSAKAHYLCHLLLAKIYGGRMWTPIVMMGYQLGRCNSKLYEKARTQQADWMRTNAPMKNLEIAKRHSEWMTGNNNPAKRPEARKLVSDRFAGIPKSKEHKAKIAATYRDPERRKAQLKNLHKTIECECGLVLNRGNFSQHCKASGHKERGR